MREKNPIEKCTRCGFCKVNCTSFKFALKELLSARGRAVLVNDKKDDVSFYDCSLCKACEQNCPVALELYDEFVKVRERLVEKGKETDASKIMIENVRKYGNPFGKVEKGKKIRKIYCC